MIDIYDYFKVPSNALDRDRLVLIKFLEQFKGYPAPDANIYDIGMRVLSEAKEIKKEEIKTETPTRPHFSARVLYTRGLGPQFYDIAVFEADNPAEAKIIAEKKATEALGENWTEVKIKPVF